MSDIYSDSVYLQIKWPCKKTFSFPFKYSDSACWLTYRKSILKLNTTSEELTCNARPFVSIGRKKTATHEAIHRVA